MANVHSGNIVASIFIVGLLSACSGGAVNPAAGGQTERMSWAEVLEWISEDTESEFIRDVVADGAISQEEVRAGLTGFDDCVAETPEIRAEYVINDDGFIIFQVFTPEQSNNEVLNTFHNCYLQWLGGSNYSIDTLAFWIAENPLHLNHPERMADCLIRNGLVPATFTSADWTEFESQFVWQSTFQLGATSVPIEHSGPVDGELPSGLRWSSPEVRACEEDWRVRLDPDGLSFEPNLGGS